MTPFEESIKNRDKCGLCNNHMLHACAAALNLWLLLWGAATSSDGRFVFAAQIFGAISLWSLIRRAILLFK